jgi:hypothetical protein
MKSASAKPKRKESATKEKPPGEKRKLCKPLSLFPLTFEEIVETALTTKPKKRAQDKPPIDESSKQFEK